MVRQSAFNLEAIDVEYVMALTKVEIQQTRNIKQKRLLDNISINIHDTMRIGEEAKNTILGRVEETTNPVNDEDEDTNEDAPLLGGSDLESRLQELSEQCNKLKIFTNQICNQEISTNIYNFGDKDWNNQWNNQWDDAMYNTWRELWTYLLSMDNKKFNEKSTLKEERGNMEKRYTEQKTKAEGILGKIDKDQFKTSLDRFQELNDLIGQVLEKVPFTPGLKRFSGRSDWVLDPSQKGFKISTRLIINEWLNELESGVNELSQGFDALSKKASES